MKNEFWIKRILLKWRTTNNYNKATLFWIRFPWNSAKNKGNLASHSVTGASFVGNMTIECIGASTPLSKTPTPLFFTQSPLKSVNCPSPLFKQFLSLYCFFKNPPLKVGFFSEPPWYSNFSSLTLSSLHL